MLPLGAGFRSGQFDATSPLQLIDGQLVAPQRNDQLRLEGALADVQRGLRHLICLGRGAGRLSLSVLPLQDGLGRTAQALLVLGKRNLCGELPMLAFAREHQLTAAEQQVLQALCAGLQPQEIAQRHGVAISTVRTQIASIRVKRAMLQEARAAAADAGRAARGRAALISRAAAPASC